MRLGTHHPSIFRLCWLVAFGLLGGGTLAQGPGAGSIQGRVYDSARHQEVPGASVVLLGMDSAVEKSVRSGKDGGFRLIGVPQGRYTLMVTAPALENYRGIAEVRAGQVLDLGAVIMAPKTDWLKSVVVTPRNVTMRIHGDTLAYNTGAMKLRVNETVEELLGRLPGLQVDADGTITYNGEKIKQLLVDGEDIFAQDPSVVARNFDASRLARVELLDRKSGRSRFSGIDDGSRTKTLNLVLKESSKEGYFGKVEAGGDPEGYYDGNGVFASFRGKQQFTALGLAANTGVTDVGGGSSGEISLLNGNTDALGASAGKGVPRFDGVALHDVSTWDGEGDHLLGNYQYSHFFTQPITTTYTAQALPDSVYTQALKSRSVNRQDQHWGYGIYDLVPDSLSAFNLTVHGSWTGARNDYNDSGFSAWNGVAVNQSRRSITDQVSRMNVGGSASWRLHSRRQPGRILSVSAACVGIGTATNGYLYSLGTYSETNGTLTDTVDQRKAISDNSFYMSGTIDYVEPLRKEMDLGLSYSAREMWDQAVQGTYDKGDGKYNVYVDSLSSQYRSSALTQQAFLTLQGGGRGWTYMGAGGMQVYNYRVRDLSGDSGLRVEYVNPIPRLQVGYTPNAASRWSLTFSGSTQMPMPAQLQPVPNNANPLSVTLGNPRLRPAALGNMSLRWQMVRRWVLNAAFDAGWTQGAISSRTSTDSLGRQVTQPVNVNGGRSLGWNGSAERQVRGWQVGLHTNLLFGRTLNYLDTLLSRTDSYSSGGGMTLKRFVPDRYAVQVYTQFTYFDTRSSVNTAAPVHYWTQGHRGSLSLLFVRGWEFRTDAFYTWQGRTAGLSGATSTMVWNGSVNRNLMGGRLVIRGQVLNVLNELAGISRTSSGNVNTESATNVLGRHWVVGAVWRFDRHGKH